MNVLLSILALATAQESEPPLIPAFFTGERLLEICTGPDVGLCSMYVAGVADGVFHAETGEQRTLCSGELNNREARKVVTEYLRDNPDVRKHAAAVAVEFALKPLIGCPTKPETEAPQDLAEGQNGK